MVARACLHLFGSRRHKLSVVKTSVDVSFPKKQQQQNKQLGIAFDYYIIIMCMEARSESNYAARNIQWLLSFSVFSHNVTTQTNFHCP